MCAYKHEYSSVSESVQGKYSYTATRVNKLHFAYNFAHVLKNMESGRYF